MQKFLIVLLSFVTLAGYSQNDNVLKKMEGDKKYKADYEKAEDLVDYQNYDAALKIYMHWDSVYNEIPNLNYRIGLCIANIAGEKYKAIPYLEKAKKSIVKDYEGSYIEFNAPIETYLLLASVYHVDYKMTKAIENYDLFLKYANDYPAEYIDSVKFLKQKSYNAINIINNPLSIKIENCGDKLNTQYPEYSPVYSMDGKYLYFTSRREGSTGNKKDDKGKYFEDIYYSEKSGTEWTAAKHIGGKINTVGHEATISISPDGKTLLIYKSVKGNGDIYYSNLVDGEWTKPELFPVINSPYWETHACFAPDMNTVYFVSNRPGGYGGRDIYKSIKIKGNWSEPENLGNVVNTQYNEDSPYMLPDGVTLYFSSEGHDNMGGFDIFSSMISEDGFWSEAENLGYPINTTEDDVFYIPTPDEKHAYYSSAKKLGFGDQDIYFITIVKDKKKRIQLRGRTSDALTFSPVKADVQIYSKNSNQLLFELTSDADNGEFYVNLLLSDDYVIKAKAEGYKMAEKELSIPENEKRELVVVDLFLNKLLLAGDTQKAKIEDIKVGEKIVLNNIFYDFDRATLRPESVEELNRLVKLMKDIPSLKIEISSHTDNYGSDEYNMKLSQDRAKSVVDFLIKVGISENRLVAKGYGETQPIATNATEEGRQLNRRTEFKILSK